MAPKMQPAPVWALVKRQHGVITRAQLVSLGFSADGIQHRIAKGRLHPIYPGVYAVGRSELTELGSFMAAVLACGDGAALSHESAAALWGIRQRRVGPIHVSASRSRRGPLGIAIHRREAAVQTTRRHGVPVTTPIETLIDLAARLTQSRLEAAINEADKLDLVHPGELRAALDRIPPRAGTGVLKQLLDRHTLTLTDSELERLFLPIARRADLPPLLGRHEVNGVQVDFYCPELGLVVETDGGRYHRTPFQQTSDRRRDHAHFAAGLIPLRFTHAQIAYDSDYVERILRAAVALHRTASHC